MTTNYGTIRKQKYVLVTHYPFKLISNERRRKKVNNYPVQQLQILVTCILMRSKSRPEIYNFNIVLFMSNVDNVKVKVDTYVNNSDPDINQKNVNYYNMMF